MSRDTIYREDAIEAIHNYWKGELSKMPVVNSEYGEVLIGDCDTLLKHNKELSTRIKDIPSADRPQGKWIIEIDVNGNTYGRCSICGMRQYAGQLNFCPDCGAMMKGANNDSV